MREVESDGHTFRALHRAVDESKDQSYVLAVLNERQLQGAYFPLGNTPKNLIREEAKQRGLAVAAKPDSHDICFIPSGDNAGWLRDRLGSEEGNIVDTDGNELGHHQGAYTYTIGQRRGLGITTPREDGKPRYVLRIEPKSNIVVVGEREELAVHEIDGERAIWCGPKPVGALRGFVQVRAHGKPIPCSYEAIGDDLTIRCDEPIMGLAPGQAAVLYDGDRVVGSSTIVATR
jgi:tRNA-specific 2-thiouridylase